MTTGESPLVVLLVEDDDAHAEIARRSLVRIPSAKRLIRLQDGQAALDYLLGSNFAEPDHPRPDLILLDMRLPKVSGLEVLRGMQGEPALDSIPVAILTTSAAEVDVMKAYREGAGGFLVKPLNVEKLAKLMDEVGLSRRARSGHSDGPTRSK